MFGKLFIYDVTTEEDRDQASARIDDDEDMTVLGVTSKTHLLGELDRLVRGKQHFSRVLVQTHGTPGSIEFNGHPIFDTTLKTDFMGRGFHTLFPAYALIYFDGCNVAKGDSGTVFLDTFGSIFLRGAGGQVFGWTSYGYGMSSRIPFIGGHTVHFSGSVKRAYFNPGGTKYNPPTPRDPLGGDKRVWRGTRI